MHHGLKGGWTPLDRKKTVIIIIKNEKNREASSWMKRADLSDLLEDWRFDSMLLEQ